MFRGLALAAAVAAPCGSTAFSATLSTPYTFKGVPDGDAPRGTLIPNTVGALYGTTAAGGKFNGGQPNATVYVDAKRINFGTTSATLTAAGNAFKITQ